MLLPTSESQALSVDLMAMPKLLGNGLKTLKKLHAYDVDDAHRKLIVYQTSRSVVSRFIERYMTQNPNHTWGQTKAQLTIRFSDVTDGQMALSLLRQC